jgi:hypothetical protein
MIVKVYVALRDEAVDCWRPVAAEELGSGLFRIVGAVPEGEAWQYQPGEIVNVRDHVFSDGSRGLVAVKLGAA